MHPLRISALMKAGVVGRDDCTGAVGPQGRRNRNADAAAIASEPSQSVGISIVSLGVAIGALVGLGAVSVPVSPLGEDWIL